MTSKDKGISPDSVLFSATAESLYDRFDRLVRRTLDNGGDGTVEAVTKVVLLGLWYT
ncbi:MAG: hypothetical protein HUU20_27220 [Pirellulales bacterium]|nr:hypothetical protein [Pirellulales bacterium]